MNWLKRKLRGWLVPEYEKFTDSKGKMDLFMEEIAEAKKSLIVREKEGLVVNGCVILVGSLNKCNVEVKPELKPEIILSKLDIRALLELTGTQHIVKDSMFKGPDQAISAKQ